MIKFQWISRNPEPKELPSWWTLWCARKEKCPETKEAPYPGSSQTLSYISFSFGCSWVLSFIIKPTVHISLSGSSGYHMDRITVIISMAIELIFKVSQTFDECISLISKWNQKRGFTWIFQIQCERLNHWQHAYLLCMKNNTF